MGLSVSAVLTVIYAPIMFASLVLVGLGTTRSWQAFNRGIGLSTIVGFEVGFLGSTIVVFAVAVVFLPIYNSLQRAVTGKSKSLGQASQFDCRTAKSWQVRLLAACLEFRFSNGLRTIARSPLISPQNLVLAWPSSAWSSHTFSGERDGIELCILKPYPPSSLFHRNRSARYRSLYGFHKRLTSFSILFDLCTGPARFLAHHEILELDQQIIPSANHILPAFFKLNCLIFGLLFGAQTAPLAFFIRRTLQQEQ